MVILVALPLCLQIRYVSTSKGRIYNSAFSFENTGRIQNYYLKELLRKTCCIKPILLYGLVTLCVRGQDVATV